MKIVIINGKGGVGKDEFVAKCMKNGNEIYNISMIDYVKDAAKRIGWNGEKNEKGRKFLSQIKDALDEYNDAPFNYCLYQIQFVLDKYALEHRHTKDIVFFVHCREPKDIARWEEFNVFTLLIRRPSVDSAIYENHADDEVFNYTYDYTYMNTGTLDALDNDAKEFLSWLRAQDWSSFNKDLTIWDDPRTLEKE